MKMSHTDIPAVFAAFLDAAVAPRATGWQKFGSYAAAFVVQHRLPQIMEQYGPIMRMAGVLDDQGMIDIDLAHNLALFAMDHASRVDVLGYLADSSDIEQLYNIARTYAR